MKICLTSEEINKESARTILSFVDKIIYIKPWDHLYPAIRSHADIQICPIAKNKLVVQPKLHVETLKAMEKAGLELLAGQSELKRRYPDNIYYNVGISGRYYFHKTSHTDETVRRELEKENIKPVDLKQGYTKCSMAALGDKYIITSDAAIYKKSIEIGLEALLLPPGGILLPGFQYGFFGGCCGVDDKERIFMLNGSVDKYIYGNELKNFIKKTGYALVELHMRKPEDIGSIFILDMG